MNGAGVDQLAKPRGELFDAFLNSIGKGLALDYPIRTGITWSVRISPERVATQRRTTWIESTAGE